MARMLLRRLERAALALATLLRCVCSSSEVVARAVYARCRGCSDLRRHVARVADQVGWLHAEVCSPWPHGLWNELLTAGALFQDYKKNKDKKIEYTQRLIKPSC